jgi:hypothetical protein
LTIYTPLGPTPNERIVGRVVDILPQQRLMGPFPPVRPSRRSAIFWTTSHERRQ